MENSRSIMKLILTLLIASAFAATTQAQHSAGNSSINLNADSETRELAHGYARAFSTLRGSMTIMLRHNNTITYVLEDVHTLKENNGILVAELGRSGPIYLINPKDIVYITNGPALKEKNP